MSVPAHSTRGLLAEELSKSERDLGLARCALLVAKEEYAQLPVERYLARLDQLAEEVKDRLATETAGPVVLQELIRTLYDRHGLRGNPEAYYDPRNSFLNDVLDRGLGIPLTLSIILLEVGWRLGLPLEGINFPHHFLVRYNGVAQRLLIDPFDPEKLRFEDQAQELLDNHYGGMVRMRKDFLRTASKREIILRLLTNLKGIYANARDDVRALAVSERVLMVRPGALDELRDSGVLLARLGRSDEALERLGRYLTLAPEAEDVDQVRSLVEELEGGDAKDA